MSYTAVSDVVVPEVFLPYMQEETTAASALMKSGIMVNSPILSGFLAGGGETFNTPLWKALSGALTSIQSGTSITPFKLTTGTMVSRRQVWGAGWSDEDLAGALAGSDPAGAVAKGIGAYWAEKIQEIVVKSLRGVFADNVAHDSSDLVNDIGVADPGTNPADTYLISPDAIIDTVFKLGDKQGKFTGILMHSVVYKRLLKENLIDNEPTNEQNFGFGVYGKWGVIVDDDLPAVAGTSGYKYWTFIFENGSIGYGEGGYAPASAIVAVETDRTAASGQNTLYTRRQIIVHPNGFAWTEASVAGEVPTLLELADADNWNRIMEAKNVGIVVLITNG